MRDKIFIIIGLVSLIGIILELFGVISESLGMLFFLGMLMFFFHAVNYLKKNEQTSFSVYVTCFRVFPRGHRTI